MREHRYRRYAVRAHKVPLLKRELAGCWDIEVPISVNYGAFQMNPDWGVPLEYPS